MQHPPAVFLVDLEINFILLYTGISAGSVTNLPLGIALVPASQAYMHQVYLPLERGAIVCLCPASSGVPLSFRRNGVPRWAVGGLTTGLGLSVFPL